MSTNKKRQISEKYCRKFGEIAVEEGFINPSQLQDALRIQVDEELGGKKRRLLGTILLGQGCMDFEQIEAVLILTLEKK